MRTGSLPILCLLAMALSQAAPSQQTVSPSADAALPKFEVATVKRNVSGDYVIVDDVRGDRVMTRNMPVPFLLQLAYGLTDDQIAGLPPWARSAHYDIVGKVSAADAPAFQKLNQATRYRALHWVLEDRFALKYHYETRELNAYVITAAKDGPKMQAVEQMRNHAGELTDVGGMSANPGNYRVQAISMARFATVLSGQLMRPVLDRTGLSGYYTFTLYWDRMDAAPGGTSLYAAMEDQLGLKLEMKKAPLPVMVIDHIEEPGEN